MSECPMPTEPNDEDRALVTRMVKDNLNASDRDAFKAMCVLVAAVRAAERERCAGIALARARSCAEYGINDDSDPCERCCEDAEVARFINLGLSVEATVTHWKAEDAAASAAIREGK